MKQAVPLLVAVCVLAVLPPGLPSVRAQDKKKVEKQVEPRVTMVIPLGAAPGKTTKLTIRGLKLDTATEIRFTGPKAKAKIPEVKAKIVSKGKAAVPDKNPEKVGDTQLVAEVSLPAGQPGEPLTFVVVTPSGETKPHPILVETSLPVVAEKEPNDGFRQAQAIPVPGVVDGVIERPRDVDVFRIEGRAGQRLQLEVLAARYGSALDSILTVYDAAGREVASNDDIKDSVDSRVEVTLPRDGIYYACIIDAHDQGGPEHVYRLVVRVRK
jgi:hypothetical protein